MTYYPNPVPFTKSGASMLPPVTSLRPGQFLMSPNGRYKLILQDDGNFVLYDLAENRAVWDVNSTNVYGDYLHLGKRAIAEVFTGSTLYVNNRPKSVQWYAVLTAEVREGFEKRLHLSVQDDGNMVLLDIQALWAYNTKLPLTPSVGDANVIGPGTILEVQKKYYAGDYCLVFQQDGNLVVYRGDVAVWNSATDGSGAVQAVMQTDGNFVLYDASGRAVWNTGTGGNAGAFAQIQSNGNFVICRGYPMWARFGFTPVDGRKPGRVVVYPDHTDPLENSTKPFPTYGHIGYEF